MAIMQDGIRNASVQKAKCEKKAKMGPGAASLRADMQTAIRGEKISSYKCPVCTFYHLTSQKEGAYEGRRSTRGAEASSGEANYLESRKDGSR